MSEAGEQDAKVRQPEDRATDFPGCGPECGCREPSGKGTKIKVAVSLVVVLAVCGILIFKTTNAKQHPSVAEVSGFSNALSQSGKGTVSNSAGQRGGRDASLSAIAELNKLAANLDTVFVVVPSKENAPLAKEAATSVGAVEGALNAKGVSTGVYTLQVDSPDYADVAAKVKAPGIAVLTKGKGIGYATGSISESSLMQAYVASTRGAACCPSGGDSSGKQCN